MEYYQPVHRIPRKTQLCNKILPNTDKQRSGFIIYRISCRRAQPFHAWRTGVQAPTDEFRTQSSPRKQASSSSTPAAAAAKEAPGREYTRQ